MRAGLMVSGILGLGTALTFGAAVVVGTLFPNGTMVAGAANQCGGGVMMVAGGGVTNCVSTGIAVGGGGQVFTTNGGSTTLTVGAPVPAMTAPDDSSGATPAPSNAAEASPGG